MVEGWYDWNHGSDVEELDDEDVGERCDNGEGNTNADGEEGDDEGRGGDDGEDEGEHAENDVCLDEENVV